MCHAILSEPKFLYILPRIDVEPAGGTRLCVRWRSAPGLRSDASLAAWIKRPQAELNQIGAVVLSPLVRQGAKPKAARPTAYAFRHK